MNTWRVLRWNFSIGDMLYLLALMVVGCGAGASGYEAVDLGSHLSTPSVLDTVPTPDLMDPCAPYGCPDPAAVNTSRGTSHSDPIVKHTEE